MFFTNTKRIIKAGFVAFWRNGYVSLASILVMVITLAFVAGSIFVAALLDATLESLQEKVDINVYFVTDATEPEVLTVKERLEQLPEVALVTYSSREHVLEEFRTRHVDNQLNIQALDELGANPFGAVLNIRAKETSQYESIASFLENDSALSSESESIIETVNYYRNQVAIERLSKIIEGTERLGIAFTIILVVVSVLITFNTIRLAIYTAREEIGIMKLVGAGSHYIRGPFVIEGIMYGVVAAIITIAALYPLVFWLGPISERYFVVVNVFTYYLEHFWRIFGTLLAAGVILGGVSSYLAVKKYLRI